MTPEFNLTNKRILITGAASGIGREFAHLAVDGGARVAVLDINARGLGDLAAAVDDPARLSTHIVDLTNWDAVQDAVESARATLGGFDVVCNVAGWSKPGRFWEQPLEVWQQTMDINVWSALYICRAAVPTLIDQGSGTIINVSSDAGRVGSKGETVYAATKAALIGLTKSLARELAAYRVTVNCLCPGPTMTPLLETNMASNPTLMEKMAKAVPLGRVGTPRDQAVSLAFLASGAAGYMTGQVISVSGGLTMVD